MVPDTLSDCFLEPKAFVGCCLTLKAFWSGAFLTPKTLLGVRPRRVLLWHPRLCWALSLVGCYLVTLGFVGL